MARLLIPILIKVILHLLVLVPTLLAIVSAAAVQTRSLVGASPL